MPLEFSNPATKGAYDCLVDKDRKLEVPGTKEHGWYAGMLSNITPAVADSLVRQGSNLLAKKPAQPPAKATKTE